MEEELKSQSEIKKQVDEIHKEIQPALYEHNPASEEVFKKYEKTISDFNCKILEVTNKIKEERPELSKYLEEMTITIPDEKYPEVTIENLKEYYDSLIALLNKYIQEHPEPIKQ